MPALAIAPDPHASPLGRRRHVMQLIETGGPGGAERVLVSLAGRLAADHEFSSTVGLLKSGWLQQELAARGLETHRFRLRRPLDPLLLLDLARHFRRAGVDLVHAHEFTMNVYGAVAGRLAGLPIIATVHGRGYYAQARRRIAALKVASRLGATLVAVSDDIRRFLSESLGMRRVRLIPNGVDLEQLAGGDRARGRAALGLPAETPVVGAIGNLYPVKGHRVLLEAAARLKTIDAHLVIAGRGSEEGSLRQLAAQLGIGERVHLLGYRDDVPDLLAAFDIYALPSFSEGQSLALIEAMAAGLPIVATEVGGNPELLAEEAGLLVPPGIAESLSAALDHLFAAKAEARKLAAAAQARARREFSLEVMMGRYRALYVEHLRGRCR